MQNLWNSIKQQLSELSKSDSYKADWYGYAKNQLSHAFLGFLVVSLTSMWGYLYFGEFMPKEILWGIVAGGYLLFEWKSQHFKEPLDTIEDWVFFSVYGAGGPILLFTEVEVGSPILQTSTLNMGPVIAIMTAHLIAGVVVRMVERIRRNKEGSGE